MNEKPVWSLQELYIRTGLPKSTLHRILATLQDEHYVRCDEGMYGFYQLTSAVRHLSKGVVQQSRLVDIAGTLLIATTKRIKWPLSIGVVDGCEMRVSFCTMPYSPYATRSSSYGRCYGLFNSASGTVYFAFCGGEERRILFDLYRKRHGALAIPNPLAIRTIIQQTRARGYGIRYGCKASDSSAFSVPIFAGNYLLGAMSFSTFSRTLDDALIKKYVPVLQNTACLIGQQWQVMENSTI